MSTAGVKPLRLAMGGLMAMAAAIGIGRFIYTPILPPMAEGLGLSKSQAGLIASANFLGYLVGALAAASPFVRSRPRMLLLSSLAVSAATTGAMAWPDDMWALIGLRFVGGVASAYVLVLASALVLDRLAAAGRPGLSAVHFAGVGTGIAISSLATWAMAAAGLDWRAMWLVGGALSVAALVAVVRLVANQAPTGAPQAATQQPKRAADASLRLLTLAYGLFGFGYVITATFLIVIVRGSSATAAIEPLFWLVVGLAAIPSVAVWVAIGRGIGVLNAFAIACVVEAIGVCASVAQPTLENLLLAAALLGGTFMGLTALGLIAARDLAPANPRRWVGLLTSAFGLGQIVGPLAAGYGFDLTGSFFLPSMLAAAALILGAGLALSIPRKRIA